MKQNTTHFPATVVNRIEMDLDNNLKSVKHKIVILSGKGGVGKSTVATQIALSLKQQGLKVHLCLQHITSSHIPVSRRHDLRSYKSTQNY